MAVQAGFATYCSELLSAVGAVRGKRMFGGYGLYVDDLFVAIIVEDTLYLKTDNQSRPRFTDAGSRPFEYVARGEQHTMGYWSVPPDAMDSPLLMAPWARLAIDAALRAKSAPARKARKKPPEKKP
jgi:DNA transformation protein